MRCRSYAPAYSIFLSKCRNPNHRNLRNDGNDRNRSNRRISPSKNGAIGAPLPGTAIKLVGEDGRIVTAPGEKGIAWHKGPHVTVGYYKEPEKTAKALQDGWLDSGDILTWTHTGELKFAGRAKDTIVLSGGENLEPAPIEAKLTESEFISQVIVVGQDKKNLGVLIVPFFDRVYEEFQSKEKNFQKIQRNGILPKK